MNRPEDIQRRIVNIRQIESIISTLRALASAHLIEARLHLDAIRAHERVAAGALAIALAEDAERRRQEASGAGGQLTILIGATQGFCGAYADRLAHAGREAAQRGAGLIVVGARSIFALQGEGVAPLWSDDMASHPADIPALANRMADALFAELTRDPGIGVDILHADPADQDRRLVQRRLWPFDFSRFPAEQGRDRPLLTLEPEPLIGTLVQEYVFSELCEGLMLGFAAENAARSEAMARAQSNVRRIAAELKGEFQRARQDQMTTEIIELSAGQDALR